uniref:Uncharacterized protein n=1 Tax=Oryza rufipogon TaxID=4529 RepID=A0A0E0PW62_ORYRU
MSGEWSVKLFDCFGDSGTCCLTCWCPCITFGRIAEIVDKGSTCILTYHFALWFKHRKPSIFVLHARDLVCFAGDNRLPMAVCLYQTILNAGTVQLATVALLGLLRPLLLRTQEYKELEKRGFNMSKGWEGSNKMVGCVQGMKPPRKQRM